MTRAVVLGSTGLVGRHLVRELEKRGVEVCAPPTPGSTPNIAYVFNAIGFTDIERAEREPENAFYANEELARAAAWMARACAAVLVHISTEFVFDGNPPGQPFSEEDEPRPSSVYARSKRAGELAAADAPHHRIVRLQNLYGVGGTNLLSALAQGCGASTGLLDAHRQIAPMWAGTAARLVCDVAEHGPHGLCHVATRGSTTYSSFANEVGVRHLVALPEWFGLFVPRPSIALECRHVTPAPPTWQESLAEYREATPAVAGVLA